MRPVAAPRASAAMPARRHPGGRPSAAAPPVAQAWSLSPDEVARRLQVEPSVGLSAADAAHRSAIHGANAVRPPPRVSATAILARQFFSAVVALLAAALGVALILAHWLEAGTIAVVLLVNAAIGFVTELRAVRSMESLRRLGQATARVRRDGVLLEVEASALVPGDVVLVEGGDVIAADLRLLSASNLQVDESTLTGESVPVDKGVDVLPADTPLAERRCMSWKGTMATCGAGEGVCVATGPHTELGRIAALALAAPDTATPLEERLDVLARRLIYVTLGIAAATVLVGILRGRDAIEMLSAGVALAVAAIPEGLPIVATLALARGLWRLAERNALVNRLSAVETLGATTIILTDKTGTLTENRMVVEHLDVDGEDVVLTRPERSVHRGFVAALEVGVLCNNAALPASDDAAPIGDPMEVALLAAGARGGIDLGRLRQRWPERREVAFDPRVRAMATFHGAAAPLRIAVKGAVEALLPACTHVLDADGMRLPLSSSAQKEWLRRAERRASGALRVLALCERFVDDVGAEPFADLTLLGLAAMRDPPRPEVAAALDQCRRAGVRVVMVTGDHAGTAKSIAVALGLHDGSQAVVEGRHLDRCDEDRLLATDVFARVEPEQKLQLIELHQRRGAVVAMTGDGVNDAPALRQADIGIAMGRRGTQVAREAADMVLQDDSFASIVQAIRQGRALFDNIRRFVVYLLSCNISEVLVVFAGAVGDLPVPVLPLQLLYLNLVTDVFPALALGFGAGANDAMRRPPRSPQERILERAQWQAVAAYGVAIAVAVLGAQVAARHWLQLAPAQLVTVTFLTLALAQLWHVFDMRSRGSSPWRNEVVANPWIWCALALCTAMLWLAVHGPLVPEALGTAPPGRDGWTVALIASLLPVLCGQLWLQRRRR